MNKICCIGDANINTKISSSPMVLRSACAHHKHSESRGSSIEKKQLRLSSSSKRKVASISKKDFCNGNLHLESVDASKKELSLQSAEKTHYELTGLYDNNCEFSESTHQEIIGKNTFSTSYTKELHFSQSSVRNSLLKNYLNHNECSSDYSSAYESDMNSSDSLEFALNRMSRRSTSSVRSMSGSEDDDDDIAIHRIVRYKRTSKSNSKSNNASNINYLRRENIHHEQSNITESLSTPNNRGFDGNRNYVNLIGSGDFNENNFSDSSNLHGSTVQYSLIDKFRWFLWRCTYMKIIKIINFDVWLLSRIHPVRRQLTIFLCILPLLLLLLWSFINMSHDESISHVSAVKTFISSVFTVLFSTVKTFTSSVFTVLLSTFSSVLTYFVQKKEPGIFSNENLNSGTTDSSHSFIMNPNLPSGETAESAFSKFSKSEEIVKQYHQTEEIVQSKQVEIQKGIENLKEEMNSLKHSLREIKLKTSVSESLVGSIEKLEDDFKRNNNEKEEKDKHLFNEYKSQINHISGRLEIMEAKLKMLEGLKHCCDKQLSEEQLFAHLDTYMMHVFKNISDEDPDQNSRFYFFNKYLNSKFFTHDKVIQIVNSTFEKQNRHKKQEMTYDDVMKIVENTVLKYVESVKRNLSELSKGRFTDFNADDMFSEDKMKKLVKEAIMLYDADKTGQVDYALESGGGSVVGTRCSETYSEKYGKVSLFGVPLWTKANSPRTAIQPDVQPGQCWAFKGTQGFLVIELAATIRPTGFTLEHIPVSLSPTGSIDSAPKNFSIWGLDTVKDSTGQLLGEYWFDITGEPLQYFAMNKPSEKPYSYIELQIHSNHGNIEYTCLYRFRVHGKRG